MYPVLLLGLQLFDPLQQTQLGSLHVGHQARHLDHIQLFLWLRHPDVHLQEPHGPHPKRQPRASDILTCRVRPLLARRWRQRM